jgi:hypothetical protein
LKQIVQIRPLQPVRGCLASAWPFGSQIQLFLLVDAMHPLVIILPSFAPKQGVNPIAGVPNPDPGNLQHPLSERSVLAAMKAVVPGRPVQLMTASPSSTKRISSYPGW